MGSRQKKHGKFAVSIEDDSEGEIELNQQTRRRRPRGPSAANRLLPEHNGLPGRSSQLAVLHQPGHNPESLEDEIGLFDVVPEEITSQGWDAYQDQLDNPCFSFASVELDDTSHGQACFCVPDFSTDEHGEYAGITVESMVHVYRVALQFVHGESIVSWLKVHEDCFNDTMAGRAFAQPLATDPQVSRVCIPDVPSDCQCDVCHEVPWDARDPVLHGWVSARDATLTSMACSVNVTVYYRPCSDSTCRGRLLYDGQHDAVFNYSGRSLFTYECMNAFWDETVDSYKTFHGHHADMKRNHERSGVLSMLPCLNVVRPALWRYLDLLDIDYADFGCPCCSHLPADELCLVMDGITMGMRKDLATLLPFQALQQPEVPDFGAQEERWDADTWMELLSECEVREPIVFKFLKFVELTTPSPLPGPIKAVLTAICTDYPISGLLDHHCVASDDPERTPLMQAARDYDNACNLHRYCLRRQAAFFARTKFLLDRMHQWGHVTCHAGYSFKNMEQDMDLVPAWSNPNTGTSFSAVTIRTFNSQAAKQCNGKLKSIRTQVAYMR
eukprot:gene22184-29246_t